MSGTDLRAEFFAVLSSYRRGQRSLSDIIDWEAQYALDDAVDADLRQKLDRVALVAEQVADKIRPEAEMRELVAMILGPEIEVNLFPPVPMTSSANSTNVQRDVRWVLSPA